MQRQWLVGSLMVLLAATCPASRALAALSRGQETAANALIEQLGDREFTVRQQAVEKLIALGPDVVPLVQKALKATNDNEIKLRCRMVLKGIADKYGITVDEGDAKRVFEASRVTVDETNAPLSEVLQALADQSGNRVLPVAEDVKNPVVSLHVKDVPYWEALNRLCASAGLFYDHHWPAEDLAIQKAPAPLRNVGAVSGPVAIALERVTWTRRMRAAREPAPAAPPAESLVCSFQIYWEDRLSVISWEGHLTRGTTPDGRALKPIDSAETPEGLLSYAAGESVSGAFAGPIAGLDRLATVEGVVRLEFGEGQHESRLEDVVASRNSRLTVEGVSLRVAGAVQEKVRIVVRLSVEADSPARVLPDFGNGPVYGLFLAQPDGRRLRGRVAAEEKAPGTYCVTFAGTTEEDAKGALVSVTPRSREKREFPFVVKEVPVP